jgi:uncharacterized membrane protein
VTIVQEIIAVDVPVHTAYEQLTDFENLPHFMDGVERVEQLDDSTLLWTSKVSGDRQTWHAKVTSREPERISWRGEEPVAGVKPAGTVTLKPIDQNQTVVKLQLETARSDAEHPEVVIGLGHRTNKFLKRFKDFTERQAGSRP